MHRVRPATMRPVRRLVLVRARVVALTAFAAVLLLASCSNEQPPPSACAQAASADVQEALRGAPERAVLSDGTLLSTCVDRAEDDAALQTLGLSLVAVADRLAEKVATSPRAAFELGFLIGAAERGAGPSGGTQAELVQRLEQTVSFRTGSKAREAEIMRGRAAGSRDG